MSQPRPARKSLSSRLITALFCVMLGSGALSVALQTVLERPDSAQTLVSQGLWKRTVNALGGHVRGGKADSDVRVPLSRVASVVLIVGVLSWVAGAAVISLRGRRSYLDSLAVWGSAGWAWWCLAGGWEVLRLLAFVTGFSGLQEILWASLFLFATILAGWMATFFTLCRSSRADDPRPGVVGLSDDRLPLGVWVAMAVYAFVFIAMNWQLYLNLQIPHGDSAQFEEHLWNLTHGRGLRSYIDRASFFSEHIQFIHVLLVPLYLLWPSQVLLEVCQSLGLASGAIPVCRLAWRHSGSRRAGLLLACTYLLYPPMQSLDIDIELKTFRPEAFGIPLLLFALDQFERGHLGRMVLLLGVALSAREDFALILAPLGVWMAGSALLSAHRPSARREPTGGVPSTGSGEPPEGSERVPGDDPRRPSHRAVFLLGVTLAVFATVYVLLVVKYVIPWFRGVEVHYVRYFRSLGGSLSEVLQTLLTNPGLVLRELLTAKTLLYAAQLLLPLGLLPLLSPTRLAVGLPLFLTLCLNELSSSPYHHFHAPLVPILFWSAAAGLGNLSRLTLWARSRKISAADRSWLDRVEVERWASHFALAGALAFGLFLSPSPLGINYWDPGSWCYWRKVYVPGRRAEMFARVYEAIPKNSRVCSTDLIHPRFTHHDRSYDYSLYPRAVNDYKPGAPSDADYIVVDVYGRYNTFKTPRQIPEFRQNPDEWELMPDVTGGYFIVLKRRGSRPR